MSSTKAYIPSLVENQLHRESFNSTLKNHISHPHCEALKTVSEVGKSSMSRDGNVFVYNLDVLQVLIESISTDLEFFDDEFATKGKDRFKTYLEGLYNIYYLKYGQPNQSSNPVSSSDVSSSRNQMTNLLNKLKQHKKAKHDRLATSEYERYVKSDFFSHRLTKDLAGYDVLGFWKANESTFPVISQMTRDILSVQATSMALELAFSTSAKRVQHTSNLENSLDFKEEILEEEVQEHEAIALSDEEVALDEAASEARSSG
ncbi:zinc finger BED domain-containing protein RICESLEEPER 2-like protein [Tanacetum coccineum]